MQANGSRIRSNFGVTADGSLASSLPKQGTTKVVRLH